MFTGVFQTAKGRLKPPVSIRHIRIRPTAYSVMNNAVGLVRITVGLFLAEAVSLLTLTSEVARLLQLSPLGKNILGGSFALGRIG